MRLLPISAYRHVFAPLRDRTVGYVRMPGNVGDALLEAAAFELMRAFAVPVRLLDPNDGPGDADTVVIAAGGNMGSFYHQACAIRERVLAWRRPVVVLPQSFTGPEDLPYARVFVRERASWRLRPDAELAPDLALGLDVPTPGEPDLGEGVWLRADAEALFPESTSRGDPARVCRTPDEYLRLAARHAHVVTDRLHFAISALLCGRKTTLLPNRYHKNRAVYECWLRDLGCGWRESPPGHPRVVVVTSGGLSTASGGRSPPEADTAPGGAALLIDPTSPRPAISVVMPVYNGGRFVRRAIQSVLAQTFSAWELLAIDDGSTDDSAALLDAAAAADPRIRVFRHPANRGLSAARNTALAAATGGWVAYLDCDDEFYPDHLARVWDGRGRGDVLVFRYDLVDERPGCGDRVTTYDPEAHLGALVADTLAVPLGVAHRRALIDRVGGFDESLGRYRGRSEDAEMWRRFARAGAVFAFVAHRSGRYHIRSDSLARSQPPPPDGYPIAVAEPVTLRIVPSSPTTSIRSGTIPVGSGVGPRPAESRPRVMFASYHCYHDPASGAAVCTRDLFAALASRGWRCGAFTGPFLDDPAATPIGVTLRDRPGVTSAPGAAGSSQFAVHTVPGPGGFPVTVFAPDPPVPAKLPSPEETAGFLTVLAEAVRRFRPDVVLTYGGDPASRSVVQVAKKAGAKVAFWLHNFAYPDAAAFAGCDAVIVPSQFSREYHRKALGIECVALPPVIDVTRVACERPDGGQFVTFVNPVPEKGVFWFARMTEVIGRSRPDIPLLVVEGRGRADWLARCGVDLRNVTSLHRMANTPDPRGFYRQTRLVVIPSLWRESFGRVAAEAMFNGIPVVASDRGALPEVVGAGGTCLSIPLHITPEGRTPPSVEEVVPWVSAVEALWDDAAKSEAAGAAAKSASGAWHPDAVVPQWEEFLSNLSQSK